MIHQDPKSLVDAPLLCNSSQILGKQTKLSRSKTRYTDEIYFILNSWYKDNKNTSKDQKYY